MTAAQAKPAGTAERAAAPAPAGGKPQAGPKPQPAAAPAKPAPDLARSSAARPERLKRRHGLLLAGFVLFVLAPIGLSAWYLYTRATDQFASYAAFSVRSEDMKSSLDILSGFSAFGSTSSKDTDILFDYIQSQGLVQGIDSELDLRAIYSAPSKADPIFAFDASGTIEDLHSYWERMVKVYYDRGTGLIELRVNAFSADAAQAITRSILDHGTRLINELNAVAREDATRYAREELERSVARLRQARRTVTEYRSAHQMVDPEAEIGIQTGLISALQTQLSEAMVDYNLLKDRVSADSPQLTQLSRRIDVLRKSIDEERMKFGTTGVGGENYSSLVGEYESLMVDLEFAQQAYIAALATFDTAQIEAQRQSRYLAAHIEPTLAERAEYPARATLLAVIALFALFIWSIGALVYYSIRDRR